MKNRLKNRYSSISNKVVSNKELSLSAMGLYAHLMSKPEDWDFSFLGISSQIKAGEKAIRSAVKELEEYGVLVRVQTVKTKSDGTKYGAYDWILHPTEEDKNNAFQLKQGLPLGGCPQGASPQGQPHSNTHVSNNKVSKKEIEDKSSIKKKSRSYEKASMRKSFELFWEEYHKLIPAKKIGKEDAFQAWIRGKNGKKLETTPEDRKKAMEMIPVYSKSDRVKNGYYLLARTYISDKRFNDEIEAAPNLDATKVPSIPADQRRYSMVVRDGYKSLPRTEWTRGEFLQDESN